MPIIIKNLSLKIESSIPDFTEKETYDPYHLIRIGPVGNHPAFNELMPSPPISKAQIMELRLLSLDNIAAEVLRIKPNIEMKLNLSSKKVLIHSHFNKQLHEEDWKTIKQWQENGFGYP